RHLQAEHFLHRGRHYEGPRSPRTLGAGGPCGPLLTGGPVRRVGAATVAGVQCALTSLAATARRPAGAAKAAGAARAASIHDSRAEGIVERDDDVHAPAAPGRAARAAVAAVRSLS